MSLYDRLKPKPKATSNAVPADAVIAPANPMMLEDQTAAAYPERGDAKSPGSNSKRNAFRGIPHDSKEQNQSAGANVSVDELSSNALQGYIDVSYHVSLSLVSRPTVTDHDTLEGLPRTSFASSGATGGTDGLSIDTLYEPTTLNIRTVKGLTQQNPELALVVEIKLGLHEPNGLSLDKNIRKVAGQYDYDGTLARVVWRLEVYWSGFDADTGEWVDRISFRNPYMGGSKNSIVYFCNLINFEANVNSLSGTEYELHMLPLSFSATRPEVIKLDAMQWDGSTVGEVMNEIANSLTAATHDENLNQNIPKNNYAINFAEDCSDIRDANMTFNQDDLLQKGLIEEGEGNKMVVSSRDDSVTMIIMSVLGSVKEVQEAFVRPDDVNKVEPRITYVVRPSISYAGSKYNEITNDWDEVTYNFTVEKFVDWRIYTKDTASLYDQSNVQRRIDSVRNAGALRRIYNYAYTSENTEVLSFDIKLSLFYWEPLSDKLKDPSIHGYSSDKPVDQTNTDRARTSTNGWAKAHGNDKNISIAKPPSISHESSDSKNPNHGARRGNSQTDSVGTATSENPSDISGDYNAQFEKRISNDLITLQNMKVIGDPIWLLSRESSGCASTIGYSEVIRVNINRPPQSRYMNPDDDGAVEDDLSLGGFYEIIEIDHSFSAGAFTQELKGFRLKSLGMDA